MCDLHPTRLSRLFFFNDTATTEIFPLSLHDALPIFSSLSVLPSPVNRRVGIHDFTFGACSSYTPLVASHPPCPPIADVCPERPTQPVTRPSHSVTTILIHLYLAAFPLHYTFIPFPRT